MTRGDGAADEQTTTLHQSGENKQQTGRVKRGTRRRKATRLRLDARLSEEEVDPAWLASIAMRIIVATEGGEIT